MILDNIRDEVAAWEKTVNLGRHFSDKRRMGKFIVDYKASDAFRKGWKVSF